MHRINQAKQGHVYAEKTLNSHLLQFSGEFAPLEVKMCFLQRRAEPAKATVFL